MATAFPPRQTSPTRSSIRPSARLRGGRPAALAALLALAGLAWAPSAGAGGFLEESQPSNDDRPTYAEPAERVPVEGDGVAAAEAELANAKLRVSEAIQNAEAAQYNLTKARRRNYPRGEALEELQKGTADMLKERRDSERDFRASLEKARREGVPAGTLMPYMDYADWLDKQVPVPANESEQP